MTGPPQADDKPLPLQLELPPAALTAATHAAAPLRSTGVSPAARFRFASRLAIAAASLLAFCVVFFAVAVPWFVRRTCIQGAADHGIELQVASVRMTSSGFDMVGVRAIAAAIPGAVFAAGDVAVETSGLFPQRVIAREAEVTLHGPWSAVAGAFARWRASPAGGQSGSWAPSALVLDGAKLQWQDAIGENGSADAGAVHVDVQWTPSACTVHAGSDSVTLSVPGARLGPWRVDVDRGPGVARVRVALDPGVPETSTLLFFGDDQSTVSVDALIPRSPLTRLGAPPSLVGPLGHDVQMDASVHYVRRSRDRAELNAKVGLYGVEPPGFPRTIDATTQFTASGDPAAGMDVRSALLAVGPFVGALRGTVRTFNDGVRADLAWRATPVPCAALSLALSEGPPAELAHQLQRFVATTGLGGLSGTAGATGSLVFDSRDLGATSLVFVPELTCNSEAIPRPFR